MPVVARAPLRQPRLAPMLTPGWKAVEAAVALGAGVAGHRCEDGCA